MSIPISDKTGKPTATSDKQLIHANQLKAKVGHLQNGEELRRDNGALRSHNQLHKMLGQGVPRRRPITGATGTPTDRRNDRPQSTDTAAESVTGIP